MAARTRFAPTPSGFLHAGNAVNFLITALVATRERAVVRLRIDDLDADRMRPEYVDDIFDSLHWLGLEWTEGPRDRADHERAFSQLERMPRYLEVIGLLKEQGDLYACGCTRSELRRRPCSCRGKGLPFDAPHLSWRLRLPSDAMLRMERWPSGALVLRPAELLTDPVVRQRADLGGRPAYQIASLVDDLDHGITHIVRGQDLLPSTACQLYLAERIGADAFRQVRFLHHGLLLDGEGHKLSKSDGAGSLLAMRRAGIGPQALRDRAVLALAEALDGA